MEEAIKVKAKYKSVINDIRSSATQGINARSILLMESTQIAPKVKGVMDYFTNSQAR